MYIDEYVKELNISKDKDPPTNSTHRKNAPPLPHRPCGNDLSCTTVSAFLLRAEGKPVTSRKAIDHL